MLYNFLTSNRELETAFKKLSNAQQIEYAEYIAEAKRDSTKQNRLNKIVTLILTGKGLNDKYRK